MPQQKRRIVTIKVDALARVEGEGALHIKARDGRPEEVRLDIYEPPRFFEALLRGRNAAEAPDITARICGICPVAYLMSACNALENLLGLSPPPAIRDLRLLLYYGEWIESHTLHIFLLHAPDFLGYASAIHLANDHPDVVQEALRVKKLGNALVTLLGGREIHPVNVRVGGFYSVPHPRDLRAMRDRLLWARDAMAERARWVAGLDFPDFEGDYEFVALRHPDEYAILEGRVVSSRGIDISVSRYDEVFEEQQVPHSNALHSVIRGRGSYLVGPLARFNLNFAQLSPTAREVATAVGAVPPIRNPFKSIIVRSLEVVHALEEASMLVERYEPPERAAVEYAVKAGVGYGASEAPRGILYHRYRVDAQGLIADANIVPPTAQNQKRIEEDLWHFAPQVLGLPVEKATWLCEQAIRNYDPCISCATHFLRLTIERVSGTG
ncbi:MAG: Ni/Fe hydrogenase subunit alpha [Chloroflexi bacterium]|nr:Ni/Fe hydrogenase subunit alpha [Chloroflexota bacterium]